MLLREITNNLNLIILLLLTPLLEYLIELLPPRARAGGRGHKFQLLSFSFEYIHLSLEEGHRTG